MSENDANFIIQKTDDDLARQNSFALADGLSRLDGIGALHARAAFGGETPHVASRHFDASTRCV